MGPRGDRCVVWGLSQAGMQRTSTVPSICAHPSSMRARRPLGPCTPHALRGECGRSVQLEQGGEGWVGSGMLGQDTGVDKNRWVPLLSLHCLVSTVNLQSYTTLL